MEEFYRGNVIPYLARNVSYWKERSNTLSVLDITLIVPLQGEKRVRELEFAFTTQVKSLGYGKEVSVFKNSRVIKSLKKVSYCCHLVVDCWGASHYEFQWHIGCEKV